MKSSSLEKSAKIQNAISELQNQMRNCRLCPRNCEVDRTGGVKGFCILSNKVTIYKYKLHSGEEPPLSGKNGSGIIFFSGCTMNCVFCQNYPFSQKHAGFEVSATSLSKIMLTLQVQGAQNINLVSGSHFLPEILKGLEIAVENGLHLPIVYNSNGFEKVEILQQLDGIVDIYLPDMKYSDDAVSIKYSKTKDYFEINKAAVSEMFRQVGHLQLDENGIATKGLLIRHLVLPNELSGSEEVFKFISNKIGKETFISLMTQYLPIWGADKFPELNRRINFRELDEIITLAENYHLKNGWTQDFDYLNSICP